MRTVRMDDETYVGSGSCNLDTRGVYLLEAYLYRCIGRRIAGHGKKSLVDGATFFQLYYHIDIAA